MKRIIALILATASTASFVHGAAVVNVSAQTYNGLSLANGNALPISDLIRVGFFNLSDSAIQANQGNLAFLNSNFIQFGVAASGDSFGIAGYFADSLTNSTTTLGIAGGQIYLWALNSTTLASATQQGIFYLTGNSEWTFKLDTANPNTANPDLSDLTNASNTLLPTAHLVVGTFPGGTTGTIAGARNFNLAPVVAPEPTTAALMMVGLVSLAARRRRQAK